MSSSPYYQMVPKDRAGNIRFRREVLAAGYDDPDGAGVGIWMMCAKDILFYLNVFGRRLEPRATGEAQLMIASIRLNSQS